jgi:hypothetical protein
MDDVKSGAADTSRRVRNWDGVAAVIAALVGLLALCVSSYTAYMQRQQVRAQVWTELMFGFSDTDHAMIALNKGVGPARLKSLRIYVDGHAQTDWPKVFEALAVNPQGSHGQSTISDTVIAPNERLLYMTLDDDHWLEFRKVSQRVRVRACYCSVLDECHVFDQRIARRQGAEIPVDRCERSEDEEFTE